MLDEVEWAQLNPLLTQHTLNIKAHWERHGSEIAEARAAVDEAPALEFYFKLTGFKETNINALWHHRVSLYGDPCPQCAKPLRTHVAKRCPECGWQKSDNAFNGRRAEDGARR